MSREEDEKLLFPSFAFPDCFPEAVTSGGEQKKARQRRRRRVKPEAAMAAAAAAAGESGGDDQAKKRRLSDEQARFLEMSFKKERKLETPRKVQLAAELGLDAKQVAVWFQNRRARHKSKLMEEEFSKLRSAHDAVVLQNCHLETELLKLKERLADVEEEKAKLAAAAAAAATAGGGGGGNSSPSSSSFSTVTYHSALVGQFGVEAAAAEEADLTYMSEYAYTNYMLDLAAAGYCGGVYDQFS
uniref:Homeobox-leucine zipper protein n=1 Tax=Leersia perrieri TaxID=77586 RepID=A0A0D9VQT1_9ORYZ